MYQVGICSEDRAVLEVLKKYILAKYHFEVCQYSSEKELFQAVEQGTFFSDILIVDIQRSESGIRLAKDIQKKYSRVKIIFIAEDKGEASGIFEAEPTYLLWRPLEKGRISLAMDKAIRKLQEGNEQILKLHFKERVICIPYQEIFFLESDRRNLIIHQEYRNDRVLMKMSEVMEQLPEYFVRCHQSYAVNIRRITSFEKNRIVLEDGKDVPVSRSRFHQTRETIENLAGGTVYFDM